MLSPVPILFRHGALFEQWHGRYRAVEKYELHDSNLCPKLIIYGAVPVCVYDLARRDTFNGNPLRVRQ